ncbi:MAG: PilZ domain-containing protein, partial [Alicyclobacillaceae bacterium]|nr:PilZ domain-containing protein [Alicyclobacillaceae bacterium]
PVDLPVRWDDSQGRCLNLSGNGCLFLSTVAMEVGQNLSLTLELPHLSIPVQARVVRVEPLFASRYRVACTFVDIDDRHLDSLLRYLLDCQRRLIREGKMP